MRTVFLSVSAVNRIIDIEHLSGLSGTPLLVLCNIINSIFTLSLLPIFLNYLDKVVLVLLSGAKLCICWLYLVLNETPVNPMYYLESFSLVMVALYTSLSNHSLFKVHTTFSLQLQSLDCFLFIFRTFKLCAFITIFLFGIQLSDSLMLFSLKILF